MKDLIHNISFSVLSILVLTSCSFKSENVVSQKNIIEHEETIYGTWIPGKVYYSQTGKDVTEEYMGYVFNFNHYKSQIEKLNTGKWYQVGSWENSSESFTGLFIDSRFNQRIIIEIPNYQPTPKNSILLTLSRMNGGKSSELYTHMNSEGDYLIFINERNGNKEKPSFTMSAPKNIITD